jgi:hypothetical protein
MFFMSYSRFYTVLFIAGAMMCTGCGTPAVSNTPPTMSRDVAGETYSFSLVKSPTYIEPYRALINSQTSDISSILDKSHVPYTTTMHGQQEVVTMLGNVITTGSKTWYLYVNDKPVPIITLDSIIIAPTDKVEWRYEFIH